MNTLITNLNNSKSSTLNFSRIIQIAIETTVFFTLVLISILFYNDLAVLLAAAVSILGFITYKAVKVFNNFLNCIDLDLEMDEFISDLEQDWR